MKVTFNQATQVNNFAQSTACYTKNTLGRNGKTVPVCGALPSTEAFLTSMPNVSFGKINPDFKFLLSQTGKLRCAYSGKPMLSPYEATCVLYPKLEKRPNAQSAINLLQNYEKYMLDVERQVFNIFKNSENKNKRNFHDFLQDLLPQSLISLKQKQLKILNGKNDLIEQFSPNIAEQVIAIRDEAIERVESDLFGRQKILSQIEKIKATGEDLAKLEELYCYWYELPCSLKDFDAFVVNNACQSHQAIAKRLISSAVATIEHIHASSRGGKDNLENVALVVAAINHDKGSMMHGKGESFHAGSV